MNCRKKAEAIVNDALSKTIFSDGESRERKDEIKEEVKDRAGSLPPIPLRKDYSKHEYMEIPDAGELKTKALSTGRFCFKKLNE